AGDFQPDITFIFDQDPAIGLARTGKRFEAAGNGIEATEDRFERMGVSFQQKVREGYLEIARRYPHRCIIIDSSREVDAVHADVMDHLMRRFDLKVRDTAHG